MLWYIASVSKERPLLSSSYLIAKFSRKHKRKQPIKMEEQAYKKLLEKYRNGTATEQELAALEQYADHIIAKSTVPVFLSDKDKAAIKRELKERTAVKSTTFKLPNWAKVAASIALVIGVSMSIWFAQNKTSEQTMALVRTEMGEYKKVTLPDGSVVELNAHSSIEYATEFTASQRSVTLTGEALFQVTKDPNRPFVVQSNGITTKVLGTVFNVNAYVADSVVTVSLLEGSVQVQGMEELAVIKPMEQSIFDLKSNKFSIDPFDSTEVVAWQNGDIVLSRTSFDQLTRLIRRKYGVTIEWDNPKIGKYTVSGKFSDPDIETLLETVCLAKSLEFKKITPTQFHIY